ncbi:MAG: phage protein Gp36 family protein [Planctomycetota bacterium]|jgi:phage gp36-like protein
MAYVANSDIEERLGSQAYVHLTDDDGDGVADVGVVDEARLGAEGEVDSYIAQRYQVPVDVSARAELAGVLASITLDLAEYRLRSRRPPVPANTVRQHSRAIDWLKGVALGEISLPSTTEVPPGTARGLIAAATGAQRVLSRDELAEH